MTEQGEKLTAGRDKSRPYERLVRCRAVVYVAGPYRAETAELVAENVSRAARVARSLLSEGFCPLCPHSMVHGWEEDLRLTEEAFAGLGLELLRRCDAVYVLPGSEESQGTQGEIAEAGRHSLPVFWSMLALEEAYPR